MRDTLQDALQGLLSPRSSVGKRTKALNTLEHLLATVAIPDDSGRNLSDFLALQDTFECNVSSHLLAWIAASTPRLELLTNKNSTQHGRESEAVVLSTQLSTCLSILQGVVLNHSPSKRYMGKKYALEVLIELLLVSRHLVSLPLSTITNKTSNSTPAQVGSQYDLTSIVLDTLLCVLVDSPCALRCFEEATGPQAVVKILKRAGTPRQVRMKCLEFLYFYLLDEAPGSTSIPDPSPPTTAPASPERQVDATGTAAGSSWPSSSFSTSRSTSWGSISSFSSNASSFYDTTTTATTCNTSPSKSLLSSGPPSPFAYPIREIQNHDTTAEASTVSPPAAHRIQPRSLLMLQREVEFVPISPKKAQIAQLGAAGLSGSRGRSRLGTDSSLGEDRCERDGARRMRERQSVIEESGSESEQGDYGDGLLVDGGHETGCTRTTEEKMEVLGGMLGNVEALVEGVRKAGVWGLGC